MDYKLKLQELKVRNLELDINIQHRFPREDRIEIKSLLPFESNVEFIFQLKVGYAFVPSPNQYQFIFSNFTSGLIEASLDPFISYLLTTIDNNQTK